MEKKRHNQPHYSSYARYAMRRFAGAIPYGSDTEAVKRDMECCAKAVRTFENPMRGFMVDLYAYGDIAVNVERLAEKQHYTVSYVWACVRKLERNFAAYRGLSI